MLVARLVFVAAAGLSLRAHAQGPPPVEIGSDASQVVEMTLSLRDDGPDAALAMQSPVGERVVRSQSGVNAERGELSMLPRGFLGCIQPYSIAPGAACQQPLDTDELENPIPFYVYEFPSVVRGSLDPWFTIGAIDYDVNCTASGSCSRWFDDAPESHADSSFDHRQGRLDVRARVETLDIGIWDFRSDRFHALRAIASASLGDWIHVTGSGPTATLVVNAALDAETDDPNPIQSSDDWITEGVGDLRELPNCGGTGPVAHADQSTRFAYRFEVREWDLVQDCDVVDGQLVCDENWVSESVALRSLEERRYAFLDYPPADPCNSDPIIVQQDTASMPSADEFQATVPTNRWLSIDALVSVESDCEGSLACNLVAQSGEPVAITLSSPDATIVSWRGVAGTTRVPEPAAAAGIATAIGALATLARRRGAAFR